jgi:RNA polymerase sigma-70 factor (ECF subfamily)
MSQSWITQEDGHPTETIRPSAIGEMVAAAFRDHAATIERAALRSSRDADVAADVTQEAFLRLLVEAQAGRFPDNVGGWLYRTSANLIISRARRVAVARRLAPRLVRTDGPAEPDAIAILQEQRHELQLALAVLAPADRVALLMAAHGASGEEIARRLERSPAAARTLLSRARGRLRTVTVGSAPAVAFRDIEPAARVNRDAEVFARAS